ncbi:MAG TPA: DUF2752 domain-containing protein [Kiritimatiellia bacterium]|nr:DUF2752 domain-containing protein [Kiritimatiellia bacterium]HMP00677.1 DUF2752 domain-containing protein [Kiritimatiellia bacterium]HMP97898.1 DUF2752 domain-containing protein [Kiritimatiellia bacterium]
MNRWHGAGGLALVAALAAIYAITPESAIYPRCPSMFLWQTPCPTCGGLRAIHHLLHGRAADAWAYNPGVVIGLALLILEGVRTMIQGPSTRIRTALLAAFLIALLTAALAG